MILNVSSAKREKEKYGEGTFFLWFLSIFYQNESCLNLIIIIAITRLTMNGYNFISFHLLSVYRLHSSRKIRNIETLQFLHLTIQWRKIKKITRRMQQ